MSPQPATAEPTGARDGVRESSERTPGGLPIQRPLGFALGLSRRQEFQAELAPAARRLDRHRPRREAGAPAVGSRPALDRGTAACASAHLLLAARERANPMVFFEPPGYGALR